MTVCDVATKVITKNNTKLADRSSRMNLLANADGSIDLYIGPNKPDGEKGMNLIENLAKSVMVSLLQALWTKESILE